MIETVPMSWIKANTKSKHFFAKGAMEFWKSRLPATGLRNGDEVFFFTSEQYDNEPRRFSLRKLCLVTGNISTLGDFQAFGTARQASKAVKDAAHHLLALEES